MLDFQAVRLLHRHGNGEYAGMVEQPEHASGPDDAERAWIRGARLFQCGSCDHEIIVAPHGSANGEAPDPTS